MPLSPEEIQRLTALKNRPRGGGGRKKAIDYNDRSYKAWFALEHTSPEDKAICQNKDGCNDPNGPRWYEGAGLDTPEQVVADVVTEESGTVRMCRYCFTLNWLTKRDGDSQTKLAV